MKTLVLVHAEIPHISQPDATPEGVVDVRKVCNGNVVYSGELMKLELARVISRRRGLHLWPRSRRNTVTTPRLAW